MAEEAASIRMVAAPSSSAVHMELEEREEKDSRREEWVVEPNTITLLVVLEGEGVYMDKAVEEEGVVDTQEELVGMTFSTLVGVEVARTTVVQGSRIHVAIIATGTDMLSYHLYPEGKFVLQSFLF